MKVVSNKTKNFKIIKSYKENKEYLKNYYNDRNNNILHIISNSYYLDKEMEEKYLSFI